MVVISNHSVLSAQDSDAAIADEHTTVILSYIFYTVLCQVVNIFGIVSNIINIMCFAKQGFKETVNISLMGLSVSDLGCLITSDLMIIAYTPAISEAGFPFEPLEAAYLLAAMPHVTFTRITSWITAIITIERCLCILVPLKVKSLVTHRRMSVIIVCAFIAFTFCGSPIYVVNKLGLKHSLLKNMTLLGLIITPDRERVEMISFTINCFSIPFVAFLINIICTGLLVYNLQQSTKWRETSSTPTAVDVSVRNKRVAKMVVMISSLFICCYAPITVALLAFAFEPGLRVGGKHQNMSTIFGGIVLIMESINSSANIFIYYQMSSKYKEAFSHILLHCTKPFKDLKLLNQ